MELAKTNQIVYENGEIVLNVSIEKDTVWLNRNQLSDLFERDVKTIGKHINNIFKDGELEKVSVVANFATTAKDGKIYSVEYYNLDVIISIGYRVKSHRGVKFRQWATSVLKSYIQNGYAINSEKITNDRFVSLENEVTTLKEKVNGISNLIDNDTLQTKQGIFYNGEIFDAYSFISDLIRTAKKEIILIDNYIDDTTLTIFSKVPNIEVTIYTHTITKQLKLDLEKYNSQYKNIELKIFKNSHDRFLILDKKELYHFFQTSLRDFVSLHGASLKDLGKKWFAFSKMDIESVSILERLE